MDQRIAYLPAQSSFKKAARHVLDLILPPQCMGCGIIVMEKTGLCPACWAKITFITQPYCKITGHPLASDLGGETAVSLGLVEQPKYTKARSVYVYDAFSRKIILRFKNADHTHLARTIASLMIKSGRELIDQSDVICPVPLHWKRLLKRKYNQSALISAAIAEKEGVHHLPDLLMRVRATPSQGTLKRKDRQINVKKAFAVKGKYAGLYKGKNVLVIDDVYTTGATVNECAHALKKSGAKEVFVLTLGRVLLH